MCGDVKASKPVQIACLVGFVTIIVLFVITGILNKCTKTKKEDTNAYLDEYVVFGKQTYIKVSGISVTENTQTLDDDGDELSSYTLNLSLDIYQTGDKVVNLSPSNFKLKSVNLESKSKMEVFISALFKETLDVMASIGIDGSVNIIEETISFSGDYWQESIKNAEESKNDFKPIKPSYCSFDKVTIGKDDGIVKAYISFPIKKRYLESKNVIVLAIDSIFKFEKHIFLITRPES
ncbi:MAG: hypothetical protein K6E24_05620 [bacterium]|nr:hypothetical protein [bacterium]